MDREVKNLLLRFAARTSGSRGMSVFDMQTDLALTLVRGNTLAATRTIARAQRVRDIARGRQPVPPDSSRRAGGSSESSSSSIGGGSGGGTGGGSGGGSGAAATAARA